MSFPATRSPSDSGNPGSWWVLAAGLLFFIAFQTGLVLEVQLRRHLPAEADDAYCYIYNAMQLRSGFNYDTPALRDLRTQSQPEPGDAIDRQNLKWELHHSLFFNHYPLYSAFLLFLKWITGTDFETTYRTAGLAGSLFIAGAFAFFLATVTDRTSAGLALGSLALTMFPQQGIHYVVPTNICMALGLVLLALLLRTEGQANRLLFIFSAVLVFFHRTGVLYAGLGLLLTAILRFKKDGYKQIISDLLPTIFLLVFYVIISSVYPVYFFRLGPMAPPPDTNYFQEVWLNFLELLRILGNWFVDHGVILPPVPLQNFIYYKLPKHIQEFVSSYRLLLFIGSQIAGLGLLYGERLLRKASGKISQFLGWLLGLGGVIISLPVLSALLLIIFLRAGWVYAPEGKKSSLHLAFFMLLTILLPSLLHVMFVAEADHPILRADLTLRLWVPFAVALAAIFGRGLWWVGHNIRHSSLDFLPGWLQDKQFITQPARPGLMWAALLVFLLLGYAPHLVQAYEERENIKHFMLIRQNVVFDPGQVEWLFQHTGPDDIIVYNDDFLRHYFLSHGGLARRAMYLPLLPLPDSFHFKAEKVKFEVGWNPYLAIQSYKNVRAVQDPLIIPGGSVYTLTLENDFQPGKLQLLPGPQKGGPAKLRLIRESAGGLVTTADLDLAGNTWQAFPLAPEPGGTLSLVNLEPAQPAALAGLRFGGQPDPGFRWPWQGVVKVALDDKEINIQREALLPKERTIKGAPYSLKALQDQGSTVLWRLSPREGG